MAMRNEANRRSYSGTGGGYGMARANQRMAANGRPVFNSNGSVVANGAKGRMQTSRSVFDPDALPTAPTGLQPGVSDPPVDATSGFRTVPNENTNWNGRRGVDGMSLGGYSFGPFGSYDPGTWNPSMQTGGFNQYGGRFTGMSFGPSEGGGEGWHLVFQPGSGGGGGGGQAGGGGGAFAGSPFGTIGGSPVQKYKMRG